MKPLAANELEKMLKGFEGGTFYLHVEAIPGAFVRNAKTVIDKAFAAGTGPFRIALKLPDDGWVRVEGITHGVLDEAGRLLLAGHDELGRLTAALEISREPFPA